MSITPLLSRNPIPSAEFWPSYPELTMKVSDILGGREILEKIPIFPLEDLQGRFARRCCKFHVTHLNHPIEIYFDGDGKASGVFLAYKIKIATELKWSCFAGKVKYGIEMIHILPQAIGSVFSEGGPASARRAEIVSSLKKLFLEGSYSQRGCFSTHTVELN